MVASNQARAFDPSQPAHLSADDGQLERLAIQMRMRKGLGAMTADNRTNEPTGALALVEEVIAIHADRIGTHYEDCYKYHVACLAVAVKRRIGGERRAARE